VNIRPVYIIVVLMLIMQVGCQPTWQPPLDQDTDATLPTRVRGTSDAAVIRKMTAFEKQGVRVITMGQNYLISIPTYRLFATQSPRLLWSSYDTLNSVVAFLNQFRKIAVNVTAYGSTDTFSNKRELALSKTRANAVANYLWSQGVDSRLVFAVGIGARQPIVRNGADSGKSMNSRIEITFRDAVA
jgi:intracellular multiplication protein IcmN